LRARYKKIRVRGSIDFPLAGVAVGLRLDGTTIETMRIGLIGTNSHPVLIDASEALGGAPLDDAAASHIERLVHKAVSPVRTGLIQPQYRRRAVAALAAAMAKELA
jgi:4-hydroxybenzoyl-CoA reductase subunit beta